MCKKEDSKVIILLHDISPEGIKNPKDLYDVVDCLNGTILFTGTGKECKMNYPNHL